MVMMTPAFSQESKEFYLSHKQMKALYKQVTEVNGGARFMSHDKKVEFDKMRAEFLEVIPSVLTLSLSLVTVQALLRPLRAGEDRSGLATRAKAQVTGKHCDVVVTLPTSVDVLLKQALS